MTGTWHGLEHPRPEGEDRHALGIMGGEHGFEQQADGVLAEIGTDIAQAQRAIPQRLQGWARAWTAGAGDSPLAPGARDVEAIGLGGGRVVLQAHQQIAAQDGVIRQLSVHPLVEASGAGVIASVALQVGEIDPGAQIVGGQAETLPITPFGVAQKTIVGEQVAHIQQLFQGDAGIGAQLLAEAEQGREVGLGGFGAGGLERAGHNRHEGAIDNPLVDGEGPVGFGVRALIEVHIQRCRFSSGASAPQY